MFGLKGFKKMNNSINKYVLILYVNLIRLGIRIFGVCFVYW